MERDIVILTDGLTGGRGKAGGETLWTIRPTAVAWLPGERAADPDAVPGPEGRIWRQDEDDVLEQKRGCIVAAPGETVERGFSIRLS